MEKHVSRDWGFAMYILGPRLPPGIHLQQPRLGRSVRDKLLKMFRKRLPSDAPKGIATVDIPTYPHLTLLIQKVQTTAAYVQFTRNVKTVDGRIVRASLPALAILLTGVDRAADDKAVSLAVQVAIEAKLPVRLSDIKKIAEEPRPLAVIMYRDGTAREDASLFITFGAVAQAFFEQFGIEGDPKDGIGVPSCDFH